MERHIPKEREQKLRTLAKLFNKQSVNPPPIVKEVIYCLDIAITPEEADFLLKVGENQYSYDQLRPLADMPDEQFEPFFENLRHKGMLNTKYDEHGERSFKLYAMIPSGWFDDTYLSDGEESPEKKEFARYFDQATKKLEKLNFFPLRPLVDLYSRKTMTNVNTIATIKPPESGQRSIAIDQSVEVGPTKVYPAHGVNELIEKYGDSIGVKHCFCRQWRKMVDDPCRFDLPSDVCISFGNQTRKYLETGVGRAISKEEAYRIIKESQEKGAVHMVYYTEENLDKPEVAVCNCCWDCCGVFRLYHTGAQPLLIKAFYYAALKDDLSCNGCGECVDYCPVNAIRLSEAEASIKNETCIGCGQCEYQCPEDAIHMIPQEREVYLPIQKKSECRLIRS
ncbi:MAG: 4Fe-4S dicluster domain-containing protein [Proteobacteria bacterium]|nr:4Fe-4S dicluster domain-containing protein [Pseudomonadota bacterium]